MGKCWFYGVIGSFLFLPTGHTQEEEGADEIPSLFFSQEDQGTVQKKVESYKTDGTLEGKYDAQAFERTSQPIGGLTLSAIVVCGSYWSIWINGQQLTSVGKKTIGKWQVVSVTAQGVLLQNSMGKKVSLSLEHSHLPEE